jgi:hypothetical protein
MTRARAIEEAARALLAANDAERDRCRSENVDNPMYVCPPCREGEIRDEPLRAALSLPADAPPDEYRRGVEDAAKWIREHAGFPDTDGHPMTAGRAATAMVGALLAPPAPSSAATHECGCGLWNCPECRPEYHRKSSAAPGWQQRRDAVLAGLAARDRGESAAPPTTVEPTAHASEDGKGCEEPMCRHGRIYAPDNEGGVDILTWRPCHSCGGSGKWRGVLTGLATNDCPSCAGTGRAT